MPASSRGASGASPSSSTFRASGSQDEDAQAKRLRELRTQLERSALFKGTAPPRSSAEVSPPRSSRPVAVSGGVRLVAAPGYESRTPEHRTPEHRTPEHRRRTRQEAPELGATESASSSRRKTSKRNTAVSLQELVALARTGRVNEPNARSALPVVTVPPRHHADLEEDRMSASCEDDEDDDDSPIMAEPVELVDDILDDTEMSVDPGEASDIVADREAPSDIIARSREQADTKTSNSEWNEDEAPRQNNGTKESITLISRRALEEAAAQDSSGNPESADEGVQASAVEDKGSESPLPDFDVESPLPDFDDDLDEPLDDLAAASPFLPASSPEEDTHSVGPETLETKSMEGDVDAHMSTISPRDEPDVVGADNAEASAARLPSSSPDSATEKVDHSSSRVEEVVVQPPTKAPDASTSPPDTKAVPVIASSVQMPAAPSVNAQASNQESSAAESAASKRKAPMPQSSNGTSATNPPAATSGSASASSSVPAQKRQKKGGQDGFMTGWNALLERTRKHPEYATEYKKRFETEGKNWLSATPGTSSRKVLGLDCEMVYVKNDRHALARVSIVTPYDTVLDVHVCRLKEDVLDYRTLISGVQPEHLLESNGALPFEDVQKRVLSCIAPETILVGHSLWSDLKALHIKHHQIVDTALIFAVAGGNPRMKHKLHSLVSLMSAKIGTLRPCDIGASTSHLASGAHDPTQDAKWAVELALYEASNFPKISAPLKLETFSTRIFLTEVPKGTDVAELKALFGTGTLSDVDYQLVQRGRESETAPDEWLGKAAVLFKDKSKRDAAFAALPRYVSVYAGPFRDWSRRRDTTLMQKELTAYFSKFGRSSGRPVRSCRVVLQNGSGKGGPKGHSSHNAPFALLECHPAIARQLVTSGTANSFKTHRSHFKVELMEEQRRSVKNICAVPVGTGIFLAKFQ